MALVSTKPVKFTDVRPGSKIEVSDVQNAYDPFEADVLEMKEEYGPQRIPALVIKADHNPQPLIILANGQTKVKVLLDSAVLAAETLPPGAERVRSIVVEHEAIQFLGGAGSAMNAIRFCGGLAATRWEPADAQQGEAVIIAKLGEELRVEIGDWILRGQGRVWPEKPDDYASRYEKIA